MKVEIFRYTKAVLFCLMLSIPYFSWSEEPAESRAGTLGRIQQEKAKESAEKENWTSIEIKNFGRIDEQYYRGAQPGNGDYEDLSALGIKTVIALTSTDTVSNEKKMVEKAGMKYYQISMDSKTPPTDSQIAEFLRIVNDPINQPVYVHCAAGKHRTGVMTAVYRIIKHKWTADQAYNEMKKYNFGPSLFHPRLKDFVYDYYRKCGSEIGSSSGSRPCQF